MLINDDTTAFHRQKQYVHEILAFDINVKDESCSSLSSSDLTKEPNIRHIHKGQKEKII